MKVDKEQKAAIVADYVAGQSSRAVAIKYGVSASFVRVLFQRSPGYRPFGRTPYVSEKRKRIIEVMASEPNLSARELADRVGVSIHFAHMAAKQIGYGLKKQSPERPAGYGMSLPHSLVEKLFDHAVRRNLSVRDFAIKLLATAESCGLIDAILDDMAEAA